MAAKLTLLKIPPFHCPQKSTMFTKANGFPLVFQDRIEVEEYSQRNSQDQNKSWVQEFFELSRQGQGIPKRMIKLRIPIAAISGFAFGKE